MNISAFIKKIWPRSEAVPVDFLYRLTYTDRRSPSGFAARWFFDRDQASRTFSESKAVHNQTMYWIEEIEIPRSAAEWMRILNDHATAGKPLKL